MRKIAILLAMMAMVLAVAVPAFAQDATAGDEFSITTDISDSFNTYAGAIQYVDQDATATQDNDVTVENNVAGGDIDTAVTNDQSIDQSAVQYADSYYGYYYWWYWW